MSMKVFGTGRLAQDPILQKVNDTHVCKLRLAVDEYRKINGERKKNTEFFDFECWDKAAELMAEHKRKGDLIEFEATLRRDQWKDQEDNFREKYYLRINDFTFLTSARRNKDSE